MPPTIYIKRGLNDALTAVNPVLGSGEMVFVRDTNTIVVGNGSGVYSSLSGISANPLTHTHSNITITAGSGLAGGGSLAANRTIDIGQGDGISVSADSIAVDSTVVRTTGTQTISGAKTFTAATVFSTGITISSSGTNVPLTITNDGTGNSLVVNDVTGDTSPFVITSNGSVGVGTSSPGALFEVNGGSGAATCIVKGESGQNSFLSVIGNGNAFLSTSLDIVQQSDNAATIIQRANASLSVWTNNTTRLTISSTGTATFAGQVLVTAGSVSACSVAPSGDPNTGLYFPAANVAAVVTDGTERVRVKATGAVRFVPLSADPSTGNEAGDVYYNSTTNKLKVYNGTSWVDLH